MSLLFSFAGVDFSATFTVALLWPICYRYAVYIENSYTAYAIWLVVCALKCMTYRLMYVKQI